MSSFPFPSMSNSGSTPVPSTTPTPNLNANANPPTRARASLSTNPNPNRPRPVAIGGALVYDATGWDPDLGSSSALNPRSSSAALPLPASSTKPLPPPLPTKQQRPLRFSILGSKRPSTAPGPLTTPHTKSNLNPPPLHLPNLRRRTGTSTAKSSGLAVSVTTTTTSETSPPAIPLTTAVNPTSNTNTNTNATNVKSKPTTKSKSKSTTKRILRLHDADLAVLDPRRSLTLSTPSPPPPYVHPYAPHLHTQPRSNVSSQPQPHGAIVKSANTTLVSPTPTPPNDLIVLPTPPSTSTGTTTRARTKSAAVQPRPNTATGTTTRPTSTFNITTTKRPSTANSPSTARQTTFAVTPRPRPQSAYSFTSPSTSTPARTSASTSARPPSVSFDNLPSFLPPVHAYNTHLAGWTSRSYWLGGGRAGSGVTRSGVEGTRAGQGQERGQGDVGGDVRQGEAVGEGVNSGFGNSGSGAGERERTRSTKRPFSISFKKKKREGRERETPVPVPSMPVPPQSVPSHPHMPPSTSTSTSNANATSPTPTNPIPIPVRPARHPLHHGPRAGYPPMPVEMPQAGEQAQAQHQTRAPETTQTQRRMSVHVQTHHHTLVQDQPLQTQQQLLLHHPSQRVPIVLTYEPPPVRRRSLSDAVEDSEGVGDDVGQPEEADEGVLLPAVGVDGNGGVGVLNNSASYASLRSEVTRVGVENGCCGKEGYTKGGDSGSEKERRDVGEEGVDAAVDARRNGSTSSGGHSKLSMTLSGSSAAGSRHDLQQAVPTLPQARASVDNVDDPAPLVPKRGSVTTRPGTAESSNVGGRKKGGLFGFALGEKKASNAEKISNGAIASSSFIDLSKTRGFVGLSGGGGGGGGSSAAKAIRKLKRNTVGHGPSAYAFGNGYGAFSNPDLTTAAARASFDHLPSSPTTPPTRKLKKKHGSGSRPSTADSAKSRTVEGARGFDDDVGGSAAVGGVVEFVTPVGHGLPASLPAPPTFAARPSRPQPHGPPSPQRHNQTLNRSVSLSPPSSPVRAKSSPTTPRGVVHLKKSFKLGVGRTLGPGLTLAVGSEGVGEDMIEDGENHGPALEESTMEKSNTMPIPIATGHRLKHVVSASVPTPTRIPHPFAHPQSLEVVDEPEVLDHVLPMTKPKAKSYHKGFVVANRVEGEVLGDSESDITRVDMLGMTRLKSVGTTRSANGLTDYDGASTLAPTVDMWRTREAVVEEVQEDEVPVGDVTVTPDLVVDAPETPNTTRSQMPITPGASPERIRGSEKKLASSIHTSTEGLKSEWAPRSGTSTPAIVASAGASPRLISVGPGGGGGGTPSSSSSPTFPYMVPAFFSNSLASSSSLDQSASPCPSASHSPMTQYLSPTQMRSPGMPKHGQPNSSLRLSSMTINSVKSAFAGVSARFNGSSARLSVNSGTSTRGIRSTSVTNLHAVPYGEMIMEDSDGDFMDLRDPFASPPPSGGKVRRSPSAVSGGRDFLCVDSSSDGHTLSHGHSDDVFGGGGAANVAGYGGGYGSYAGYTAIGGMQPSASSSALTQSSSSSSKVVGIGKRMGAWGRLPMPVRSFSTPHVASVSGNLSSASSCGNLTANKKHASGKPRKQRKEKRVRKLSSLGGMKSVVHKSGGLHARTISGATKAKPGGDEDVDFGVEEALLAQRLLNRLDSDGWEGRG